MLVRDGNGVGEQKPAPPQKSCLVKNDTHTQRVSGQVSGAHGFCQKNKKFNQMSFGLIGPDGHPQVRIGTHTRLDPRAGLGALTGQFPDPHPHLTGAKPAGDPPREYRLPSLPRR
jgi:hypothetical protein